MAEQGLVGGRVHAHFVLGKREELSVADRFALQDSFTSRFGISSLLPSLDRAVHYLTKYALKEFIGGQWAVFQIGGFTGSLYLDMGDDRERLEYPCAEGCTLSDEHTQAEQSSVRFGPDSLARRASDEQIRDWLSGGPFPFAQGHDPGS